jgi:acyl-CoA thioester hydrolase
MNGPTETVQVHFDDLDPMGIVHNAKYAVLVERALTTFWARHGHSFADGRPTSPDVFHAVREFAITYHVPVRGTGPVDVHFWLDRMGATSADYGFEIRSADGSTVHATGRRAIVRLDPATLRPTPWTEATRTVAAGLLSPERTHA